MELEVFQPTISCYRRVEKGSGTEELSGVVKATSSFIIVVGKRSLCNLP